MINTPRSYGFSLQKTLVLVGMMGVGKTSVGLKLAKRLGLTFKDSDQEVEKAAGCTISDIYQIYGEAAFIDTEKRVIERILDDPKPKILSTGVGAFIRPKTRELIQEKGISLWLNADIEDILARVTPRTHRPQLEGADPRETITDLLEEYRPLYAQAQHEVMCHGLEAQEIVDTIITMLEEKGVLIS